MKPVDIDEDKMIDLYVNQELTAKACALSLGVSQSALIRRLKKNGITIRPPTRRLIEDIDDKQVVFLYWDQGLSVSETANSLGRSCKLVKDRLKKSGRGLRTWSEGSRLWRGSDHITDEQLIYLYDVCGWSCEKISAHFNKSSQFTRHRFIAIGKKRRKNTGKNNGSWKGGITDIRNAIRSCAASLDWRKDAFIREGYKSNISGMTGQLNCHHIYPFHIILRSSITKHSPLSDEYRSLAIIGDDRFYDDDNSLVISKEEHDRIESSPDNSHPWWKIWRPYPSFAVDHSSFDTKDFESFEEDGQIYPVNYNIEPASIKEIKPIVRYEHYLGTLASSKLKLVAKRGNVIIGIATFGLGSNRNIAAHTWELTRLCIPFYVVRPFACEFLKQCCTYIRTNHSDVRQLIAFADSSVGHNGGVYRMANWNKAGRTPPGYAYFDPATLQLKHKATCRRIKGVDKTERELSEERGFIRIPLGHKYRYTFTL